MIASEESKVLTGAVKELEDAAPKVSAPRKMCRDDERDNEGDSDKIRHDAHDTPGCSLGSARYFPVQPSAG
jgi:hypothetical protein